MKFFSSKSRGFSLIELLVVITIISLLTGVIVTSVSGSRGKARDAQRVSDLGQLQLAMALYLDRCNQYPSSVLQGSTYIINIASGCTTSTGNVTMATYINQIPTPPTGAGQTGYDYATYTVGSSIVNYVLHANLEFNSAASSRGLSATPSGSGWANNSFTCANDSASKNYCVSTN
jgi:prepilin-type N-terminal cleavage/methylation domain-containing protein